MVFFYNAEGLHPQAKPRTASVCVLRSLAVGIKQSSVRVFWTEAEAIAPQPPFESNIAVFLKKVSRRVEVGGQRAAGLEGGMGKLVAQTR